VEISDYSGGGAESLRVFLRLAMLFFFSFDDESFFFFFRVEAGAFFQFDGIGDLFRCSRGFFAHPVSP